ncbi:hypothetical protein GmHk_07G018874 [Glycine max]|nr:hypothetical protein GmHk_07G018874 [Glycine max]
MRRRSSIGGLVDLDWEIEAACRRNNKKAVPVLEEPCSSESSSTFPQTKESHTGASEAHRMAEDQPRRDALLAQNKFLSKQLETLMETLSKLPTQLNASQLSPSVVLQVAGFTICGGAHESGCCIPTDETAHEVNYMGNQPRPNFNVGRYSGFQHGQNYNQQQGQWRSHPGNLFNNDQGGPSNRPQQQWPNLYERTTRLEETLAQFL